MHALGKGQVDMLPKPSYIDINTVVTCLQQVSYKYHTPDKSTVHQVVLFRQESPIDMRDMRDCV